MGIVPPFVCGASLNAQGDNRFPFRIGDLQQRGRSMSIAHFRHMLSFFPLAAAILALTGCDEKHPQVAETPPPAVEVALPVERTVTDYQVFTARTQAVMSADVKPRVTGYLTKILFKDGDMVKEGEALFQIDDRPYKATLDQAKATLDVAKASLDVAKAALEVAKAALVKNQADYDIGLNVKKDNPGAISDQEIVKRLGARDEAKGNIDKANSSILEAKASIAQAAANLEMAQLNFDWCKVTAPFSGRSTRHLLNVGDVANQNVTVLVNIVSLKPTWAYINVDQNTARRVQLLIKEGKIKSPRSGEIPVSMGVGVGSDESFPIAGVIDYVSNQLDSNTGTIQVRSVYANEDETLFAGLFARIKVPVTAPHQALLINDQAIGTNQGQRYVLVVNDKNEVEYRAVDVGQVHQGLREVMRFRTIAEPGTVGKDATKQVEVLKLTDRVIVIGMLRARPGDKVDAQLVDMQTLLAEPSSK
jgi:multidrug efflux system membrane fusion protein